MTNLLHAGIRRYLKSVVFWLALVILIASSVICSYSARKMYIDDMYTLIHLLGFAVMITWLVGRESDEGIFRNKVIAGHSKGRIYLSELIVGVGACTLIFLVFMGSFIAFNSYIFSEIAFSVLARMFIDLLLVNTCYGVILVTLSCLIPHRAIIAIVNILLVLGLSFSAYSIENIINQEEYYIGREYEYETTVDENGDTHMIEKPIEGTEYKIENPNYVGGPLLKASKILYDVVPYGHINQYISLSYSWFGYDYWNEHSELNMTWAEMMKDNLPTEQDSHDININLIYSSVTILVVLLIGYVSFRKRELK